MSRDWQPLSRVSRVFCSLAFNSSSKIKVMSGSLELKCRASVKLFLVSFFVRINSSRSSGIFLFLVLGIIPYYSSEVDAVELDDV